MSATAEKTAEKREVKEPTYPVDLTQYENDAERRQRLDELQTMQTPQALLEFLATDGSGQARCDALAEFLRQQPDASLGFCFEWARDVHGMQRGTLLKMGRYIWGDGFRMADPNSVPTSREDELLAELKQVRQQLRDKNTTISLLQRQKLELSVQNERLRLLNLDLDPTPTPVASKRNRPPRVTQAVGSVAPVAREDTDE